MMTNPNPTLDEILDGIDKDETETKNGWWETSEGAEFGTRKKAEIIDWHTNTLVDELTKVLYNGLTPPEIEKYIQDRINQLKGVDDDNNKRH